MVSLSLRPAAASFSPLLSGVWAERALSTLDDKPIPEHVPVCTVVPIAAPGGPLAAISDNTTLPTLYPNQTQSIANVTFRTNFSDNQ